MTFPSFLRSHGWFIPVTILLLALSRADAAFPAPPPPPDTEIRSLINGIDAGTGAEADARKRGRTAALEKTSKRLRELEAAGLQAALSGKTPGDSVRILGHKEGAPGRDSKPRLWLETETGFVLKDPKTGGRPSPGLLDRADLLDIRIWTDKKKYREGETVLILLQGNRDFHARVIRIDGSGRVIQLLPNNYRQISVFEKDKRYRLPDEGDRHRIEIVPPFGAMRFVVYASRLPMSHINMKTLGGGIYEYRSSREAFGRSVRRVIPAGEERMTEFCEASWNIETLPR
jgi:hypothetical protein